MARYIEEDENGNRYIVDDGVSEFQAPTNELGPNYDRSIGGNIVEGITEAPKAVAHMVGDTFNVVSPYTPSEGWQVPVASAMQRAGAEQTIETVGGLSAGFAGAGALAPWAAGWGSVLGPWGTAAGGALGAGVGFAGGMLGFDLATDIPTEVMNQQAVPTAYEGLKPADQYAKDLAYNSSQGTLMAGATELGMRAPGIKKIVEPFSQAGADRQVYETLNRLEPGYAQMIDDAMAPAPGAQGPMPDPFLMNKSLGELIDSDVLRNAQRTVARGPGVDGTTGTPYGRASEVYRGRNDAQLKYLDQIETGNVAPVDAQAAIRSGVEGDMAVKNGNVGEATIQVENALGKLPAQIDPMEAGNVIRTGLAEGLETVGGKVDAGFTGAGQGFVDRTPAKIIIAEEMPKYFKEVGAQPNGELIKLVESITREGEPSGLFDASGQPLMSERPYTIQDMQALRSQAIKIVKGGDSRSGAVAGKIIGAIDESFDNAVNSGTLKPQEVASLREGIAARKEQGRIFESKGVPAKSVLDKEYSGNYKVPDSAIPSKYWRPGDKGAREAMQNYKEAFGNTPEALDPIYRYATDSFRRAAVNADGVVDAKKARNWINQHAEVLKEAPDLQRQFENIDTAQTFLNEKFGDLKRTQAEVQKGALQLWLKDIEPQIAIREMLSGKDMAKRTKATVDYLKGKDPDAVAGLRRGVIEHLKERVFEPNGKVSLDEASLPGGPQFDGRTRDAILASEWVKLKPALESSKLFTESQMKGFDYLYKDKSSQLTVEKARMSGGADTAQNLSTLAYFAKAAQQGFLKSLAVGPTSKFILSVVEPILRKIPAAKFQATLEEALLNPRIARDLQNKATSKNITNTSQAIFGSMISEAIGTPGAAGLPASPVIQGQQPKKKLEPPKQQKVIAQKSFPDPKELLNPAVGALKKTSFDPKAYAAQVVGNQPAEVRARVATESDGNPFAVSPKGAQGLSQLMPKTAQDIATELGEPYMPLRAGMSPEQQAASIEQNVRFGTHYLNVTLPKINPAFKNKTLAWAAYNAGPGRVEQAMKMAGTERDVNKILSALPKGVQKETVPYIDEIMARVGTA